ncbi:MAG: polymerase subunit delta [Clostridia bacterium]|nr:polymerase subunit delta [Clostridia bacterium]
MSWSQLEKTLKGGRFAPVYLFYGQNDYLMERAVKTLRSRLLGGEFTSLDYQELDGREVGAEEICEFASTMPMMAEVRLVVVKEPPFFQKNIKESERRALLAYLEAPAPTACLVFVVSGQVNKQEKLIQAIARAGEVIEFSRLKEEEFNAILKKEAARYGRKINPQALILLAQACNFDLRLALQELEKLDLYLEPGQEITVQVVSKNIPGVLAENAIFRLVDALGSRKPAAAVKYLRELLLNNEAPLSILGMIGRQMRLIFFSKILVEQGYSGDNLAATLGVPAFVARKIVHQGTSFSLGELRQIFDFLLTTDLALKSGAGDPGLLLEQAIWHICSKIKGAG